MIWPCGHEGPGLRDREPGPQHPGQGEARRDGPGGDGVDPRPRPGGGYMISSGNSLASYLKPDCVLVMAGAIRKYGTSPLRVG